MDNFSHSQVVRKAVVATRGGVVAAQHRRAAEVGAAVLEAGGDAVDAAVATSFALGVVEPWMSGPAAGGCMVLWRAGEQRARVVDYGMRSPLALDPADYPLTGDGRVADLFPWPAVVDDRNVQGASAVAVPGVVAGTILVFIPVMGTFIVSDILGGRQVILVGNLIQRQFLDARDPTFGSAASLILMIMTLIVTYFYTRKFGFGEEIIVA